MKTAEQARAFVKKLLLGQEPVLETNAVGVAGPSPVQVWLEGLGEPLEVTENNVGVALRPFTIAMSLPARLQMSTLERERLRLVFQERAPHHARLGEIRLVPRLAIDLEPSPLWLFETRGYTNRCLSPLRLHLNYLEQQRRRRQASPYNFKMDRRELHSLFVFYTCPRPVVLVSVSFGNQNNMFPMDLIGTTDGPRFLMALRNTSPAVALMKVSRRMALSAIPMSYKAVAYRLGKHHSKERIDWDELPFDIRLSPRFSLPIPTAALHLREVEVEQTYVVGSHTMFITRTAYEERLQEGLQLAHVQGFYQALLKRDHRALPAAP